MRILAVRGENLASLAEPFEIDLSAEPLAGAGLFAITGETGAGKSTLLDAICLALYGEFPRISGRGADETLPDVADDTIRARDPRSILRRGTARGFAEVDFVGIDGGTYRARWEVYRARNRAGGRLQDPRRAIERLAADGSVAETLADRSATTVRVVELTDLTFEQFGRTVLLAQGDFDAFLRAGERERAELLEKITGTEIYATLSRLVWERAKEVGQKHDTLAAQRSAIGLIDPDERAARLDRRRELDARLGAIEAQAEAARDGLSRLDAVAAAEARLEAARAERIAASADDEAAEDERQRLAAVRRALALKPAFDRHDDALRRHDDARRRLGEVDARLAAATPKLAAARTERDVAGDELRRIVAAIAAFVPQWEAAAHLDTEIVAAEREVGKARDRADDDAARLAGARDRLDRLDRDRERSAADFVRLEAEIAAAGDLARLSAHRDEVAARLDERRREAEARTTAASAARTATTRAGEIADRLAAIDRAETSDAAARAELAGRVAERRAALEAIGVDGLEARDAALGRLIDLTTRARPLAEEAERAAATVGEAATAAATATGEITTARTRRDDLRDRLEQARDRRRAQAAAAALADAVASAEAVRLRERLVEGEPCPVCGARDHPVTADPAVHAALVAVRAERAELEAEIATLESTFAATEADLAGATARLEAATARAATARALGEGLAPRLAAARTAIAEAAAAAGLDHDLAADRLEAAAGAARDEGRRALDRARALRREIDRLGEAIARADAGRDDRRRQRDADTADLATARITAAGAEEARRQAERRIGEIDRRIGPLLACLGISADDLDRDGPSAARACETAIAGFREREAERDRRVREIAEIERDREVAVSEVGNAETAAAVSAEALADRDAHLATLVQDRAGLLGGRPTAAHKAETEAARGAAETRLATAEAALTTIRIDHDSALAQREERHQAVLAAIAELGDCDVMRGHALAAADLDLATARELVATPEATIADLAARLEALTERRRAAEATATARAADLAERTAEAPEGEAGDVRTGLEAVIAEADAARAATHRELGALAEGLAADDRARETADELDAVIATARADRDVWGALDIAVGSADGAKFRRFAQGFTLDRLTGLANRHLATLNPRYQLRRAEGLGLVIVDRDMGEEVRSTRSLSGGERFLASLALALALSGLEGRRSFVDTLFIDEGFGALDAATLDVAIDALESLQSEGRKVGVISHVAALHERIGVQIRVERAGVGRSRVRVTDGVYDRPTGAGELERTAW